MIKEDVRRENKRGMRMSKGRGWELINGKLVFVGTLLKTINRGKERIAIFSVRKK